jgi:hypothetical protein
VRGSGTLQVVFPSCRWSSRQSRRRCSTGRIVEPVTGGLPCWRAHHRPHRHRASRPWGPGAWARPARPPGRLVAGLVRAGCGAAAPTRGRASGLGGRLRPGRRHDRVQPRRAPQPLGVRRVRVHAAGRRPGGVAASPAVARGHAGGRLRGRRRLRRRRLSPRAGRVPRLCARRGERHHDGPARARAGRAGARLRGLHLAAVRAPRRGGASPRRRRRGREPHLAAAGRHRQRDRAQPPRAACRPGPRGVGGGPSPRERGAPAHRPGVARRAGPQHLAHQRAVGGGAAPAGQPARAGPPRPGGHQRGERGGARGAALGA